MLPPILRTVIASVGVGLCAGCTAVIPGTATSENPVADPPPVASCLNLTTEDVEVMTTFVPRVSCDDPGYTAQVYATADLGGLDAPEVTDLTRDQVAEAIEGSCDEATLFAFLGADPVETPFVFTTFFTPIQSQWELGARWAYCVVAYGNENDALDDMPYREVRPPPGLLEAAFTRPPAAAMRTCVGDPGSVPCTDPHLLEYLGHEVVYPPSPTSPAEMPWFVDRTLAECEAARPAYVAELPPGFNVAILSLSQEVFDPSLDFIAWCVVGISTSDPAATVVGSVRD